MLRIPFRRRHAFAKCAYSTAQALQPTSVKFARFTAQEDEIILQKRLNGYKFSAIAESLGRSLQSTHARWKTHISRGHEDDTWQLKNKRRVTAHDLEQVAKLMERGYSPRRIAEELGVNYRSVICWRNRVRGRGIDLTTKRRRYMKWSSGEEARLLQMFAAGLKNSDIARQLERSVPSIKARLQQLVKSGRTSHPKVSRWLPKDEQLLTSLKEQNLPWHEIVKHFPGRTVRGIAYRWRSLREYPADLTWETWTEADNARLSELRNSGLSWKEIARQFPGRTAGALSKRWSKRHEAKARPSSALRRKAWSQEEVNRLQDLVRQHGDDWKVIGGELGRARDAAYNMWRLLQLGESNHKLTPERAKT